MADCVPFWDTGKLITCKTSAAVTGRLFVKISGDLLADLSTETASEALGGYPSVAHGTGAQFGVAAQDAGSAERVSVFLTGSVVEAVAGGTVTAGQEVEAAASGKVITLAAGVKCGYAISSGVLDEVIMVKVY